MPLVVEKHDRYTCRSLAHLLADSEVEGNSAGALTKLLNTLKHMEQGEDLTLLESRCETCNTMSS